MRTDVSNEARLCRAVAHSEGGSLLDCGSPLPLSHPSHNSHHPPETPNHRSTETPKHDRSSVLCPLSLSPRLSRRSQTKADGTPLAHKRLVFASGVPSAFV